MKSPKDSAGEHHKQDAGESTGQGSTGEELEGQELNKEGKPEKGGGYTMKGGKLCKMEKADIGIDDLEKSLDRLEDFAADDPPTRKAVLLQKAQDDELTKAEQAELFNILGGDEEIPDTEISDNIVKSFNEGEELKKAIDVSDYLRENQEALEKSLRAIGNEIQKSDNRRHEFALLQAKALIDIGNMVKSMAIQLDTLTDQPVRGPKSRGAHGSTKQLEKSFGGRTSAGEQLSKGDVLDALEDMAKSNERVNGENVSVALSKYEISNMISKNMLNAVMEHRKNMQAAH